MKPTDWYEKIESAEHELARLQHKYLESKGWRYTCDTPSCHWAWVKTIPDGRTVMVATDFAISMQRHADSISEERMPA